MSKHWSRLISQVQPYTPGEQPREKEYVKLNTNENPYPPSPQAIRAMREAANEDLRLYPHPAYENLREAAGRRHGLNKEQVFVGNGSDEILAFSFLAFFDPDEPLLIPAITYSFYTVYADIFQVNYQTVPLKDDFSPRLEVFLRRRGNVLLPNPNTPTGKTISPEEIEKLVAEKEDKVVIIDEAYVDFGGRSAVPLIRDYPNLLITRTLSKSHSLAGLRVGYALGQESLVEGLWRVKNSINPYTLDRISARGAAAALEDEEYCQRIVSRVVQTRERTGRKLEEMGFQVVDSNSNFLLVTHPDYGGEQLFKGLKERGILVRYFPQPPVDDYFRVSVGSEEEMDAFLDTLAELV